MINIISVFSYIMLFGLISGSSDIENEKINQSRDSDANNTTINNTELFTSFIVNYTKQSEIFSSMHNKQYKGKWDISKDTYKILRHFVKTQGDFYLNTFHTTKLNGKEYLTVDLSILDDKYKDNWGSISIYYRLPSFNDTQTEKKFTVSTPIINPFNTISFLNNLPISIVIKFKNLFQTNYIHYSNISLLNITFAGTKRYYDVARKYEVITGEIISDNFSFSFTANDNLLANSKLFEKNIKQTNYFLCSIAFIGTYQLFFYYRQIQKQFRLSNYRFENISSTLIAGDIVWNTIISVTSISISFTNAYNTQGFMTVAFIYFFVFGFLQCVILFYSFNLDKIAEMLKCLAVLFCSGVIMMTLFYNLLFHQVFITLFISSTFIPQIIYNMTSKSRERGLSSQVIFTMIFNRLFIPLYIRGKDENIFYAKKKIWFCAFVLGFHLVQIIMLRLQEKFGGDFLIPKVIKSNSFRYKKNITTIMQNNNKVLFLNECSICGCCFINDFQQCKYLSTHGKARNFFTCLKEWMFEKKVYIMVTPCNHIFHCLCLMKWIQMKNECPLCRKLLPAMYELE